ncbi:hypothetical protein [Alkalicoccobacillus porphyridii]|uniref:Uncharacterized protein n=1 Tax=Alkalicoccobacillus porphyridii TaxID=2597270 RepID=A0A553ZV23_9BACI|nr:hypothetical protein [Alkalicoccobacillus porphyridii]TSB45156.1 hypothetical protein FN960_17935 [Alkalicoccobacillus porphyridii]
MAFGINRKQLNEWKNTAANGDIAFLTHYWLDERFPGCTSVTKVACTDVDRLANWGEQYGLKKEWIHKHERFPHFDLFGEWQQRILKREQKLEQLTNLGNRDKK